MKKVEMERQAILKALDNKPNITEAAEALGASRRTLQARMRDYDIPPGEPGRPRNTLPREGGSESGVTVGAVVVVGLAFGLGYWLMRKSSVRKPDDLHGLDVVLAGR